MTPGDYIVTKKGGAIRRRPGDERRPFLLYPGALVTYHGADVHGRDVVTCGDITGPFSSNSRGDADPSFFRPHTA